MSDYSSSVDDILGQEFLTWLWYRSDTSPDSFVTEDGEGFTVSMEQRIIVQGGNGDAKETASVSGAYSSLGEARFGLSMGKKVVRALLHIEKDSMIYQFVVKADDFTLSSVRTPTAPKDSLSEEDDPESTFLEKLFLIENCADFLDTIYTVFIKLRLSREWEQEVAEIRKWMTESV
ncbi:MAG: hypothetical protein IJU76_04885 [Desulfovibrionaceae bacterium]|nr:hypothetical protein [Desulfovibrionaceae bacterium]